MTIDVEELAKLLSDVAKDFETQHTRALAEIENDEELDKRAKFSDILYTNTYYDGAADVIETIFDIYCAEDEEARHLGCKSWPNCDEVGCH